MQSFPKKVHVPPRPKVCSLSSVKLLTIACFLISRSVTFRKLSKQSNEVRKENTQDLLLSFSPSTRQSYLENTLLSLQRF